MKLDN